MKINKVESDNITMEKVKLYNTKKEKNKDIYILSKGKSEVKNMSDYRRVHKNNYSESNNAKNRCKNDMDNSSLKNKFKFDTILNIVILILSIIMPVFINKNLNIIVILLFITQVTIVLKISNKYFTHKLKMHNIINSYKNDVENNHKKYNVNYNVEHYKNTKNNKLNADIYTNL
jgi:hypothetical protein